MQYPPDLDALPLFDLDFSLRRHGDMETVELLLPIAMRSLEQALQALDNTTALPHARSEVLHRLRGSCLELGLDRLVQATREYHNVCRTDGNDPSIADAHDRFMPVLRDTLQVLKAAQPPGGQRKA